LRADIRAPHCSSLSSRSMAAQDINSFAPLQWW
jgi:hypothetical protein